MLQDPGYQKAPSARSPNWPSWPSRTGRERRTHGGGDPGASRPVAARSALPKVSSRFRSTFASPAGRDPPPRPLPGEQRGAQALRDAYISADGTAARLQVVLDSGPYSPAAITRRARPSAQVLSEGGFEGVVEGDSAVLLDLRDASNRDMTRAIVFVLGGVFVVLLLLLRALVAPIYLILTILLSYARHAGRRAAALRRHPGSGRRHLVGAHVHVRHAGGPGHGLQHLPHRPGEGGGGHRTAPGPAPGWPSARTGGIITSAGIIMAGTFASMMSASLLGLLQIGFAVAFGVLLDTFVVRTTLVPAIIVLLGRWSWWPRGGAGPGSRAGRLQTQADVVTTPSEDCCFLIGWGLLLAHSFDNGIRM